MHRQDSDFFKPSSSKASYNPQKKETTTNEEKKSKNGRGGNEKKKSQYQLRSKSNYDSDTSGENEAKNDGIQSQVQPSNFSEELFSTQSDTPTPVKLSQRFSRLLVGSEGTPLNLQLTENSIESSSALARTISQSISFDNLPDELLLPENASNVEKYSNDINDVGYDSDRSSQASTVVGPFDVDAFLNDLSANESSLVQEESIVVVSDSDEDEAAKSVEDSAYSNFVSPNVVERNTNINETFFNNIPELNTQQVNKYHKIFRPSHGAANTTTEEENNSGLPDDLQNSLQESIPESVAQDEQETSKRGHSTDESDVTSSSDSEIIETNIKIKLDVKLNIHGTTVSTTCFSTSDDSGNEKRVKKPKKVKREIHPVPVQSERSQYISVTEEQLLDEFYGDTWKTPTLTKKLKKSKDDETNKLRKFCMESTKIQATKNINNMKYSKLECHNKDKSLLDLSTFKIKSKETERQSDKKHLRANRNIRPKHLQICDSDTSTDNKSSSSSDSSWKLDNSNSSESTTSGRNFKKRQTKPEAALKGTIPTKPIFSRTSIDSSDDQLEDSKIKLNKNVKESTSLVNNGKRRLFTQKFSEDEDESENVPCVSGRMSIMDQDINRIKNDDLMARPQDLLLINKNITEGIKGETLIKRYNEDPKKEILPKAIKRTQQILKEKNNLLGNKLTFLQSLDVQASESICDELAIMYRKCYKTKKEELALKLFNIYNDGIFESKLDVPISWSKKLTQTAGKCCLKRLSTSKEQRAARIELSEKVLTSADRLRCTLIHEMCHAATWIFDGETGHGMTWKTWTIRARKVFPELPEINVCHQYKIEYKYTYRCKLCNAESHAHSKSKKVENIRCRFCHGSIQILLNKKDKEGNVKATPVKEAAGFAKFVKEQYKNVKTPQMKHADVMKALSVNFSNLNVDKKFDH